MRSDFEDNVDKGYSFYSEVAREDIEIRMKIRRKNCSSLRKISPLQNYCLKRKVQRFNLSVVLRNVSRIKGSSPEKDLDPKTHLGTALELGKLCRNELGIEMTREFPRIQGKVKKQIREK
jgi:hypothetical protein